MGPGADSRRVLSAKSRDRTAPTVRSPRLSGRRSTATDTPAILITSRAAPVSRAVANSPRGRPVRAGRYRGAKVGGRTSDPGLTGRPAAGRRSENVVDNLVEIGGAAVTPRFVAWIVRYEGHCLTPLEVGTRREKSHSRRGSPQPHAPDVVTLVSLARLRARSRRCRIARRLRVHCTDRRQHTGHHVDAACRDAGRTVPGSSGGEATRRQVYLGGASGATRRYGRLLGAVLSDCARRLSTPDPGGHRDGRGARRLRDR